MSEYRYSIDLDLTTRRYLPQPVCGRSGGLISRVAERLTGFRFNELSLGAEGFVPKDSNKGKKGQDWLRHKVRARSRAREWLKVNPNARVGDFMATEEYDEAVEGTEYGERAVRGWMSDPQPLPFNLHA